MPTNESVMLDILPQIKNLWVQTDSTTTVKHYHMVYDVVWERSTKLGQVICHIRRSHRQATLLAQGMSCALWCCVTAEDVVSHQP